MKLVNLTAHTITIALVDGQRISIPPDPRGPARVSSTPGEARYVTVTTDDEAIVLTVSAPTWGPVVGLPEEVPTPIAIGDVVTRADRRGRVSAVAGDELTVSVTDWLDGHGVWRDLLAPTEQMWPASSVTGRESEPPIAYIVSALVASRCVGRPDVYSPGTGPADGAIRYPAGHPQAGQIEAVTRLVRSC